VNCFQNNWQKIVLCVAIVLGEFNHRVLYVKMPHI